MANSTELPGMPERRCRSRRDRRAGRGPSSFRPAAPSRLRRTPRRRPRCGPRSRRARSRPRVRLRGTPRRADGHALDRRGSSRRGRVRPLQLRRTSATVPPSTITSRLPSASSRRGGRSRTIAIAPESRGGTGWRGSPSCRPRARQRTGTRSSAVRIQGIMAVGGRRSPMRIEMPESRFADLDGPVHFVEWDGPPGRTIVLVHGLGGSLLSWLAVAPGLAKHGRVLALDLPGFGRSDRGGRRSRVSDLRTTVSRFIDEVADGGPVVLVGNSMGGGSRCSRQRSSPRRSRRSSCRTRSSRGSAARRSRRRSSCSASPCTSCPRRRMGLASA